MCTWVYENKEKNTKASSIKVGIREHKFDHEIEFRICVFYIEMENMSVLCTTYNNVFIFYHVKRK